MSILRKKGAASISSAYRDIVIKFISGILISLLAAILVKGLFWEKSKDLIHAVLGMTSVCMGTAIFLIIWSKQERNKGINDILGFGFLAVSIFDFMHIYYFRHFIEMEGFNGELSIRYWMLARLTEVIILLIFSIFPYFKSYNKYLTFCVTIFITGLCLYILNSHPFPGLVLADSKGATGIKICYYSGIPQKGNALIL